MSFWRKIGYAWNNADNVSSLYQELDVLRREVQRLKTLNRDQDNQIRDLLAAHPMTDAQLEDIALVRKDNDEMRDQVSTLTVYLRTRFPSDFQTGVHRGRKLADICINYLARLEIPKEKDAAKV